MSYNAYILIFDKGNCYPGRLDEVKTMLKNKIGYFIENRNHTFVNNYLNSNKEVKVIGDFSDLISFMAKHEENKKFAIYGISNATAGSILLYLKEIRDKKEAANEKTNDINDNKMYAANNLFVANVSPKINGSNSKHIFEKIEHNGKIAYKEIISGTIATTDKKNTDLHHIDEIEQFSNYFPKMKKSELPKIALIWAMNFISCADQINKKNNKR